MTQELKNDPLYIFIKGAIEKAKRDGATNADIRRILNPKLAKNDPLLRAMRGVVKSKPALAALAPAGRKR